jgi:putative DNA primase/helicase
MTDEERHAVLADLHHEEEQRAAEEARAAEEHAEADPSRNGAATEIRPIEVEDDPHRLARLAIDQDYIHDGQLTLRTYREERHVWDGTAYRPIPESEFRAGLTQTTKEEMDRLAILASELEEKAIPPRKVTQRLISDVAHAATGLTILPSRIDAPAWISERKPFPAMEVLAAKNGLVHLPSYLDRRKLYVIPHAPDFFSPNSLDYAFDPQAPLPSEWLGFLKALWPEDRTSIEVLQEWMGYLLTLDTRQQKILILIGPRRSGKGTIARVIRGLVGIENVAGPTLSSLGTNFGLWPLLGKSVAIISDARLSGRTDSATVTERLLSISGEDPLTVDRKYLVPVTTKLGARIIILTNELPKLGDSSGALAGRMILLSLTQSWYGKEDIELTDRLLTELPGILLWAIDGWKRLRDRGHFLQPDSGRKFIDDLEDLSSPIGAFVREECVLGPECEEFVRDLFAAWRMWCESKGRKDAGNEQVFGRDLRAAVPSLDVRQPRDGGKRIRKYVGIRLRFPEEGNN